MTWIDIAQFILIFTTIISLIIIRGPVCPHDTEHLRLNQRQLDKLWSQFYAYEVLYLYNQYYIKRIHKLDGSSHLPGSWLTRVEAETRMKYPKAIKEWRPRYE